MPMVMRFVINSDLLKGAAEWERSDLESALESCRDFVVEVGYQRIIPNLSSTEIADRDAALPRWAAKMVDSYVRGAFSLEQFREHSILLRVRDPSGTVVLDTFAEARRAKRSDLEPPPHLRSQSSQKPAQEK